MHVVLRACDARHCNRYAINVTFGQYSYLHATRVGEAKQPGPVKCADESVIMVANVTAIYGKHNRINEIPFTVACVSETSATRVAQADYGHWSRKAGVKVVWSEAVGDRTSCKDGREGFRGESLGVACLSRVPVRPWRGCVQPHVVESRRVLPVIVRMPFAEIMCLTIYGFPRCHPQARQKNNWLLEEAYRLATDARMPFIVGGDFNDKPTSMAAYAAFEAIGCIEACAWSELRGQPLPPTCKGSTSHDTAILHPLLVPWIQHMQVCHEHAFDVHSPLLITFKAPQEGPKGRILVQPHSFAKLRIDRRQWEVRYAALPKTGRRGSVLEQFRQWTSDVEKSLEHTMREQTEQPAQRLTKRMLGRCGGINLQQAQPTYAPKSARDGGYEPPDEVFALQTRLKVRQVRRLQTLYRAVKFQGGETFRCLPCSRQSARVAQSHLEWKAILHGRGYGNKWSNWIAKELHLSYLPLTSPDLCQLEQYLHATKADCDEAAKAEAENRREAFKIRLQNDFKRNHGKTVYKVVRQAGGKPLANVPHTLSCDVTLMRCTRGKTVLRASRECSWRVGQQATFGGACVTIQRTEGTTVEVRVEDGIIPSQGILQQRQVCLLPDELFAGVREFWGGIWNRDTRQEEQSSESWQAFEQEIESIQFPETMKVEVDTSSLEIWQQTIRRMQSRRAAGFDGWRPEEFKLLPATAVADLSGIGNMIYDCAIPPELMAARMVLLEKRQEPTGFHDSRPITILGVLCRLLSKIVADQILSAWSKVLPETISGGLPLRGSRDLSFIQQAQVEHAHDHNTPIYGFTLDLVKAFNCFPRKPLAMLFRKVGLDTRVYKWWLRSLECMERYPVLHGVYGEPIGSTTGVPEGDSMSVVSMILISSAYYFRLLTPRVTPYTYADNWSWLALDVKSQVQTMIRLLNLLESMRLKVDFAKSWVWDTRGVEKSGLPQLLLLFPGGGCPLKAKRHVKDLGTAMHYGPQVTLVSIEDRLQSVEPILRRLHYCDIPVDDKATAVQSAIWPRALYGSEAQYIGETHFSKLRRRVAHALVGDFRYVNPIMVHVLVSERVMDPVVYTVVSMLRLWRRLHVSSRELAEELYDAAVNMDLSFKSGPAHALRLYAHKLQWTLLDGGWVQVPYGASFCLFEVSSREAARVVKAAWDRNVAVMLNDRKGVPMGPLDPALVRKVLPKLTQKDRKCLSMNLTGGFQSACIKHKWNKSHDEACELCGQPDTRPHRILQCEAMKHVRERHKEAMQALEKRPQWVYIILPQLHRGQHELTLYHHSHPHIQSFDVTPCSEGLVFFTDGSVDIPTHVGVRQASYAVIQAMKIDSPEVLAMREVPEYQCKHVAFVRGAQTISRAELSAVISVAKSVNAIEESTQVTIYTDSQYVCNLVGDVNQGRHLSRQHKRANWDLIVQLAQWWKPQQFKLLKVKAHRKIENATDPRDMYLIIGNQKADEAAKLPTQVQSREVRQLKQTVLQHDEENLSHVEHVLRYWCDLNVSRIAVLEERKSQAQQELARDEGLADTKVVRAMLALRDAHAPPYRSVTLPALQATEAQAIPQGPRAALQVWQWVQLLQWPERYAEEPHSWGITWFELYINFVLCVGSPLPVPIPGKGNAKQKHFSVDQKEIQLLSAKARSVHVMSNALRTICCNLRSVTGQRLMPDYVQSGAKSMMKMCDASGKDIQSGLMPRPKLPHQDETVKLVWQFIQSCGEKVTLSKEINDIPNRAAVHLLEENIPPELEPSESRKINDKLRGQVKRRLQHEQVA